MAKKKQPKVEPLPEPKDPKLKKKDDKKNPKEEDPLKPLRGLVIGDNFGWTGKLPATLVHEHCQKLKWRKVIFDMKKTAKGFVGIVDLSWENPKTKEVLHVKMMPDDELYEPKATTNEARHYAATYALHRLNYIKNMKMLLPLVFRDYWVELERRRVKVLKENKNHHDNIYNVDPFSVVLRQREEKQRAEKERMAKQHQTAKVQQPTMNIMVGKTPKAPSRNEKSQRSETPSAPVPRSGASFPRKAWDNAPLLDFPSETRVALEHSIKHHIEWVDHTVESQPASSVRDSIVRLGFREAHVDEALKFTNTFIDALEWLLFYVPEDDLPSFFSRGDKDTSVSLKISKDIQYEYRLKRLAESGFDEDEILSALEDCNHNEVAAAIALTYRTVDYSAVGEPSEDSTQMWNDEIDSFAVIGTSEVVNHDDTTATIKLAPNKLEKNLLALKAFKPANYPNDLPGLQVVVTNPLFKLASYIKLSIVRELVTFLVESGYVGDCCLFAAVEWLEDNISRVIANPGPLAASTSLQKKAITTGSGKDKKQTAYRSRKYSVDERRAHYETRQAKPEMSRSLQQRQSLPAWAKKDDLVSVINSNRVTLVTGETGSGKSTQIVQFILDEMNKHGNFDGTIMCTQPRRISTIGLAERISDERIDKLGLEVGYVIRGETKTSALTRITFVTTGVLLRMLQLFLSSESSSLFKDIEYIFIDEVHERSVDSDFLLIIIKRILHKHKKLKVVLMSATIDSQLFDKFFGFPVNHIHIEGRTFPITDHYLGSILEDIDYTMETRDGEVIAPKPDSHFFKSGQLNYDLVAQLCVHIDKKLANSQGSILVFLPGIMEISQCIRAIEKVMDAWCLPLHSALTSKDQKRVFSTPPKGLRKIVVSTNVAETSITIPDCVVVIDSGRSKQVFYDSNVNSTKLVENWCSYAEVMQRRGRSGRITAGTCYHLYTKETEREMIRHPVPEIRRIRLENLYLIVKSMGISNVEGFFSGGLDVPDASALQKSQAVLKEIGALTESGTLSHLGKYLSYLPTDLASGKLLIYGCIFGCVEICLTLASIMSAGSPFLNSFELRDQIKQAKAAFAQNHGDLIGAALAYTEYEHVRRNGNAKRFIADNHLSFIALREISSNRAQFLSNLKDMGFIPLNYSASGHSNRNNGNLALVRAIITGAFYPNIARVQLPDPKYVQLSVGAIEQDPDFRQVKYWVRNDQYVDKIRRNDNLDGDLPANRAFIHPLSLMFTRIQKTLDIPDLDKYKREDGTIDLEQARLHYKPDLTPQAPQGLLQFKHTFVVYAGSSYTDKLNLQDVTPTSTLAVLLFGGQIRYDLSNLVAQNQKSPGIVLDHWVPIRTWCKNGVLIKRIRVLIDQVIENILSSPNETSGANAEILSVVENMLQPPR